MNPLITIGHDFACFLWGQVLLLLMLVFGNLHVFELERLDKKLSVGRAFTVLEALLVQNGWPLVGMVLGEGVGFALGEGGVLGHLG